MVYTCAPTYLLESIIVFEFFPYENPKQFVLSTSLVLEVQWSSNYCPHEVLTVVMAKFWLRAQRAFSLQKKKKFPLECMVCFDVFEEKKCKVSQWHCGFRRFLEWTKKMLLERTVVFSRFLIKTNGQVPYRHSGFWRCFEWTKKKNARRMHSVFLTFWGKKCKGP